VPRTPQSDGAATRARILKVAHRRLADHGATTLTIRNVARDAGVAPSVVHHYFATKPALLDACIELAYAELRMLAKQFLEWVAEAGTGDLSAIVERGTRIGIRYARQHRETLRVLMRTVVDDGGLDPERRRSLLSPFLSAMTGFLAIRLGVTEAEVRMRVQTLVVAVARYALTDEAGLADIAGVPLGTAEQASEDHLAALAVLLLAGSPIATA
jgi:AcrR family transcriptional regulator